LRAPAGAANQSPVIPKRSLAFFGDLEPFDFGRLAERPHDALRGLSRESHVHHHRQLVGRESVCAHDFSDGLPRRNRRAA